MRRIAVIMSLYKNDTLPYVSLALESIINQTFGDFDLYIKYDGLINDEINTYVSNIVDHRLFVYKRDENKGLAQSLNELLALVKQRNYTYIARMDADDISEKNRFEKQVKYLESHPSIDMVGGAINEIDEKGNDRGKITIYPCAPTECRNFFAKRNPVAHPTVMFRRSFFEKAGWAYPTDFVRNEDTRLWHEGYKHGCVIANIPDVVLNFRMTESMFKQRRNGMEFAKSQLLLRKQIKKDLGYGIMADIYAYATFLLMISPSWVLKIAYKILR
jgi:glycosyltransferase involved in cell wall biosynthesis